MSKRIVVTGGAGFIGSNFCRWWAEHHPGDHIVALDALTYAGTRTNLTDLEHAVSFAESTLPTVRRSRRCLMEQGIDTVVNFAAESHNSLAVLDPSRFFRTNAWGTQQLLEACRQVGIGRFHHISTCEVYGDLPLDSDEVFTEDSPYLPTRRTTPPRRRPITPSAPITTPSGCRSRSPTARTTTARTSFRKR